MLQPDDSDSLERERSLLSLGDALRDEPAPEPSRLARALAEVRSEKDVVQPARDAAARHRLARSRRSARETPLLNALRNAPEAPIAESQPEPEPMPQPAKAREKPVAAAMPDMLDEPDFPSAQEAEADERRYEEPARPRETPREEAAASMWEEPAPQRRPAYREPPAPSAEEVAERRYEEPARSRETRREEAAASMWEEPARQSRPAYREPAASPTDEAEAAERRHDEPEPASRPRQEEAAGSMWEEPAQQRRPAYREPEYREAAPQAATPGDSGGLWNPLIDPGTVVAGIIRSKWIIAATTIVGALLGVLIALNTPKQYEAAAEMVVDPRDLNLGTELTQSSISNEATLAIVENQVRFITSGTVISKVVEQLHLAEDPEFNGQGPATGLKGILSPVLSVFRASDGEDDPGRRYALAVMNLRRALSVERGGKTFVIVVGATTESGEKSATIANKMTEVFQQSYGQLQSDAAGRATTELTSKLDELRKGVETAERKVETFRAENDLVDAQGRLISDDEILKLNEQLSIARARTLELNARAASTRSVSTDAVLAGSLPEDLASPSMQELRAQYSALKGESDRLAVRLGPRHPQRLALEAQLSGARGLIDAELKRVVSSIQTDLKRAVQLEQELSSRLAQLKVKQGSLSDKLVTLRELERDATAKRAVYEAYLLRARETDEQQGINSANITVISKAYAPLESNPPSRSTIALAGMLLGLMAGVGIGGVRGTLQSLRDRASGRPPRLAWRLRRRPAATMFGQDDGLATVGETSAETAAESPADTSVEQGLEPAPEPGTSHSQYAYSSEPPKDTTMQHPFAMPPPPFDPNQPQAPAGYAAQGYAQQPMPQATYPQQPSMQPAGYAPQQPAAYPQPPMQPSGYMPQQPQQPAAYPQQPVPPVAYAQSYYPPYPQQQMQPVQQPQPMQQVQPGYAQPYGYAQPIPPQQAHYAQPAPGYWQPFPPAPVPQPYVQPMPAYPQAYAPQPQQQPMNPQPQRPIAQSLQPAEETPIEEIRASLREFRDAIRDLAESRSRRRYF
jgi:uncharacterized protein involved in exopolysaccharide biosynthesis